MIPPLLAAEESLSAEAEVPGQQLVAEAASRLALQPAVAARIRQKASLFGQELVGAGSYQQVLSHGRTLVRLELKLQVDDQLTTLQQINDGAVLWVRRDQGAEKKVGYVNLRRVRDAANKAKPAGSTSPVADALAIGGLPQLLQGLDRNFEFGPADKALLGNVPVWIVRGQWKKERLTEILRRASDHGPDFPPQLPDRVTLFLGRDDFVPLFPYRIEYTRTSADTARKPAETGAGQGTESAESIVRMEFFEVRCQWDIDPNAFKYPYGDQVIEDHTDLYLRRLGLLSGVTPSETGH